MYKAPPGHRCEGRTVLHMVATKSDLGGGCPDHIKVFLLDVAIKVRSLLVVLLACFRGSTGREISPPVQHSTVHYRTVLCRTLSEYTAGFACKFFGWRAGICSAIAFVSLVVGPVLYRMLCRRAPLRDLRVQYTGKAGAVLGSTVRVFCYSMFVVAGCLQYARGSTAK